METFVKVGISEIIIEKDEKTTEYSINPTGNINGLHLTGFNNLGEIKFEAHDLEDLINLTHLNLSGNQISDISILEELKLISNLSLSDNQISDISPIKELKRLTYLNLSGYLNSFYDRQKYSLLLSSLFFLLIFAKQSVY